MPDAILNGPKIAGIRVDGAGREPPGGELNNIRQPLIFSFGEKYEFGRTVDTIPDMQLRSSGLSFSRLDSTDLQKSD